MHTAKIGMFTDFSLHALCPSRRFCADSCAIPTASRSEIATLAMKYAPVLDW